MSKTIEDLLLPLPEPFERALRVGAAIDLDGKAAELAGDKSARDRTLRILTPPFAVVTKKVVVEALEKTAAPGLTQEEHCLQAASLLLDGAE